MSTQIQNTKKVTVTPSRTTDKQLVKVSRVAYGHIDGNNLVITREPSEMVLHSLNVFADKNGLTIYRPNVKKSGARKQFVKKDSVILRALKVIIEVDYLTVEGLLGDSLFKVTLTEDLGLLPTKAGESHGEFLNTINIVCARILNISNDVTKDRYNINGKNVVPSTTPYTRLTDEA